MQMTELRRIREALGVSRVELAKRAAIHENTVIQHELGILKNVTTQVAQRIADALGVEMQTLFFAKTTGKPVNKGKSRNIARFESAPQSMAAAIKQSKAGNP